MSYISVGSPFSPGAVALTTISHLLAFMVMGTSCIDSPLTHLILATPHVPSGMALINEGLVHVDAFTSVGIDPYFAQDSSKFSLAVL